MTKEQQGIIKYLINRGYIYNPEFQEDAAGKYITLIKDTYNQEKIKDISLIKIYIY